MPFNRKNDVGKLGKATCASEDYADNALGILNEETASPDPPSGCLEDGTPAKFIDLNMLSVELQERSKVSQKLQDVVEQASRFALERLGPTRGSTDTPLDSISATTLEGSQEYGISRPQTVFQSIKYDADVNKTRCLNFPGRDVLEHAIEEYSQQVSDLQRQLGETYELHDQQKFNFRQTIIELQTKLHESQIEKYALVNLRLKESGNQSELMRQLQQAVVELRSLKQEAEQKLEEAQDRSKALTRRAEGAEQALQDVLTRLSEYERLNGTRSYVCNDRSFSPSQLQLGSAAKEALHDLENDNHDLQERLKQAEGNIEELLKDGQGRTESLLKEQKKREQVESQDFLHQTQISDPDSALDTLRSDLVQVQQTHKVKVSELEEVLAQAVSQAEQALRERDLSLQQAEELEVQLGRLTTELHQTAEQLSLERKQRQQLCERDMGQSATIQSLKHKLEQRHLTVQQLESLLNYFREECQSHLNMKTSADTEQQEVQSVLEQLRRNIEQLQQVKDEAMRLQERSNAEVVQLRALLVERDRDRELLEEETRQGRAQLEEAQAHVQVLHDQAGLLCLKLEDVERSRELLRRPVEALQEERSGLTKQLEQLCQDNQQLKAALQETEMRLKAMESEKSQWQAALSERTSILHQLTLEKQQVTTELNAQRVNLVKLKEEQEALKEKHISNSEELQAHNSKLKAQLTNTRSDLEQCKASLRALEGADGHGLKVALGMQKRITAKREKIDFLQSRVQMLEETTEKLAQEKHYQVMESKRQAQELLFERESRRRLEAELETLQTSEKLLKSKTKRLDSALHKMSDSFAECQEFIQKQEQEIMRLKLQHALELKELQGQNIRATGNTQRSPTTSPTPRPTFQTNSICPTARPSSALKHRSLVKEMRCVIEDDPHTSLSASRRSEETSKSKKCEVTEARKEPKHGDSYTEQGPFPTTDLGKQNLSGAVSADNEELEMRTGWPCYTSSPCMAARGRRSPVHTLLTSDPPTDVQLVSTDIPTESPVTTVQIGGLQEPPVSGKQDGVTWQTCKKLQSKLDNLQNLVGDLQIKNQEMSSMIKSQERRIRKVKDQNQPLKR